MIRYKNWNVKTEEKDKNRYKFAARMVRNNVVENYKNVDLDYVVTYHQKYKVRIYDGRMVLSINFKLTTM